MTVSLSIKDVPEALAAKLRKRAERNHRSLQRELMAIVEAAVLDPRALAAREAAAPAYAPMPAAGPSPSNLTNGDCLLTELDAIVAQSRWGSAPLLTREQSHDRRLQRELDYEARRAEGKASEP